MSERKPVFVLVSMEKIAVDNCAKMCQQAQCSQPYTHFCNLRLNNMDLHLAFCEEHGLEFEQTGWEHREAFVE